VSLTASTLRTILKPAPTNFKVFGVSVAITLLAGVALAGYLLWPLFHPQHTFDIHSMMGKAVDENGDGVDINEVEAYLAVRMVDEDSGYFGTDAMRERAGVNAAVRQWIHKDTRLSVLYRVSDRKVLRFFLSAEDYVEEAKLPDAERLLEMGNLAEDDADYSTEFVVNVADPRGTTGVRVTPTRTQDAPETLVANEFGLYVGQVLYIEREPTAVISRLTDEHEFEKDDVEPGAEVRIWTPPPTGEETLPTTPEPEPEWVSQRAVIRILKRGGV
jgi:hypothetical protein